jgi:preprotein translocase subunit SecE
MMIDVAKLDEERSEEVTEVRPGNRFDSLSEGSGRRSSRLEERRARRAEAAAGRSTDRGRARESAAPRGNPFVAVFRFFREVVAELRKVIWPNRKQMVTYTTVVLAFVVFMVALIGGLDFGFIKAVSLLFG